MFNNMAKEWGVASVGLRPINIESLIILLKKLTTQIMQFYVRIAIL